MTPFQDYVALGAACISAALLFASTPAQSTKSNTYLHQAAAGTMLARSSKEARVACAGAAGTSCANSGNTEARNRCLSAYAPMYAPELPRLAACMPATE